MWRPFEEDNTDILPVENCDKIKRTFLPQEAKEIVSNVYNYLKEKDSEGENLALIKTSEMTKVPYNTVRDIVSGVRTRKKRRDAGNSRIVNSFQEDTIRRKIYAMYAEKMLPSIRILYQRLKDDKCEINCSLSTLHSVLHKIGFRFKKIDKRQTIMETRRIREWRFKFLREIKKYRAENRPIIYLDETSFDTHDTVPKSWTDDTNDCAIDVPPARGKRIIILHAGCDQGWINGARFLAGHNAKNLCLDYHDNMTANIFETWFCDNLLPNLPKNSVIVMDNASYHSRQIAKIPSTSMKKAEIQEYLINNDLYFEESYNKKQLLEVVQIKPPVKQYVCDNLAKQFGHDVLRLPPYYCIFNPIELIWGQLKCNIRRKNTSPTVSDDVIELIISEMNNITPELWANSVRHVIDIENQYIDINNITKDFIINIQDSSDDSEMDCDSENDIVE